MRTDLFSMIKHNFSFVINMRLFWNGHRCHLELETFIKRQVNTLNLLSVYSTPSTDSWFVSPRKKSSSTTVKRVIVFMNLLQVVRFAAIFESILTSYIGTLSVVKIVSRSATNNTAE